VIEFKQETGSESKKCSIYVRVSTEEQARKGLSLKAQIDLCKSYAFAKGWILYKVYRDGGYSASSTQRPAFQHMLQDAEDKKFNIILVGKFINQKPHNFTCGVFLILTTAEIDMRRG